MKTAILVTFVPRTRLVIDIPEGMSLDTYLAEPDNASFVSRLSRQRMACELGDYLNGDNMNVELDEECPAGALLEDMKASGMNIPIISRGEAVKCPYEGRYGGQVVEVDSLCCRNCKHYGGKPYKNTILCNK